MVTPELLTYITGQKKAGVGDDQLRQALHSQGWSDDDIAAATQPGAKAASMPPAPAGKAPLPPSARGWSWGAAGLTWVWGIKFKVWLSFITFVLNGIWWVVLGVKGREWAWQAGEWKSVEEFQAAMKPWDRWGLILFILSFLGLAIYIVFLMTAMPVTSNLNAV